MPSSYLQTSEYATYGCPNATAAQVTQASTLIDLHLKRPEGLVWTPDAAGNPAYMAALTPAQSFTLQGSVSPGANVAATLSGPVSTLQVGDVLIADRTGQNGAQTEALTIAQINGANAVFRQVAYSHASGATLDAGMAITEQRFMPKLRPITLLSRTPVAAILSGTGRYGYGRRGESGTSNMDDFNLLAAFSKFGGPPVWELFNPATTDVDPFTGQLWVPAGIMLAYYTEVKVRYVAGFAQANLPSAVKQACAMLANTLIEAPNLGAVKSYSAGDTAIQRFADTMISGDVKEMLRPYQIRALA